MDNSDALPKPIAFNYC